MDSLGAEASANGLTNAKLEALGRCRWFAHFHPFPLTSVPCRLPSIASPRGPLRAPFSAIHRPTQPITPNPPGPHNHRPVHRFIEDDHRVVVAPPTAIALALKLRVLPGMRCALDQRNRMQQDLARARQPDVLACTFHAIRGPVPGLVILLYK